tara:strand:- start:206 stop:601 length:396 start_codon:yes stop_codon:yes gene_type:complete
MEKKYLAKIIANDQEGLQMVSACVAGAKIKISDIKYLQLNKIFLLSGERNKVESENDNKKVNFVCKFDFISKVKSKNINQKNQNLIIELIALDYLKNNDDYEINLIFSNNAHIALTTETLELSLEDQNEIN